MKRNFLVLCMFLFPIALGAQNRVVTPFTPRVVNEDGFKEYVRIKPKAGPFAASVGYGFMPASSIDQFANQVLPYRRIQGKNAGVIESTTGSIMVAFNWEINPWLELTIPLIYSHNNGRHEYRRVLDGSSIYAEDGTIRDDWFTLMPSIRVNWMRTSWLSLYSRVGAGISLANRVRFADLAANLESSRAFAWQVSPVGIEMGRRVCFFVEGGYGFTGVVTGGVKFKMGKVVNKKVELGRQVDWYDKYLP